jgi:predicted permease
VSWGRYLRRRQWDAERGREIEAYLEIETAENIARGMSIDDASAAARRKFGNPTLIREDIYRMNTVNWIDSTWRDLRYGARLLRLNPGFFAVATISLVLGIGANAAIFQLFDAVRMRLLPVPHAEQLARLQIVKNDHCCSGDFPNRSSDFTYAQWEQIRAHNQAFSSLFAWGDHRFNLADGGEIQWAEGLWVSGDFFKTLGISPLLGRLISGADDAPGCGSPAVVISHSFWQRQFGADPQVAGKDILIEGHRLQVSGVAPASFFGAEVGRNFDVALPVCAEPLIETHDRHLEKRDHWWLGIIGRLNPGWTVERAAAQLNSISGSVFEATVPANYRPDDARYYAGYKLTAVPGGTGVSQAGAHPEPLYLLLAITGLVLLIACANLANLMLARASAREREIAVRLAIGADRFRLVRQLLAESLLVAFTGAAGGIVVSQLLSRYLVSMLSTEENPVFLELRPDWTVVAFTASLGILTCILFGLYPALRATRTEPVAAMKSDGRGLTASREKFGVRRALVVSQVALSLVLLVGALLFVRSLRNLLTLDAGFREDGVLIAGVDISRLNYSKERRAALYDDLLERLRATPGVQDAASTQIVQVSGNSWNQPIEILGQPSKDRFGPWFNRVSANYFRTMGTPLLAGRDFNDCDTTASPEVAIVNEKFSAKFLGGANPIGKEFRMLPGPGAPQHVFRIVGMVKNSKYRKLREDFVPTVFVAAGQNKNPDVGEWFLVRSATPLVSLMPQLKRAILVSPAISLQFQVFKTQLRESLLSERVMATLSGFFGFLAAVLATVGLYGVISYMVARRRNEIGIRIALGADRASVLRLVMREAGLLLILGLALGTGLSIAAARAATSLLYGLQPSDPLTIVLAIALLAAVAIMASGIPALRAARLNPMTALREE